jgi:hypothetical protein
VGGNETTSRPLERCKRGGGTDRRKGRGRKAKTASFPARFACDFVRMVRERLERTVSSGKPSRASGRKLKLLIATLRRSACVRSLALLDSHKMLRTTRPLTRSVWTVLSTRSHSSHSSPPSFSPIGSTSADTEIPYGDPTLASSAYLPSAPSAPPPTQQLDPRATSETPELTPRQRKVLEEIVRVDQAGELGANYIYYGQHAVLSLGRDTKVTELVQVRFSSFFPLFPSVSLLYSH